MDACCAIPMPAMTGTATSAVFARPAIPKPFIFMTPVLVAMTSALPALAARPNAFGISLNARKTLLTSLISLKGFFRYLLTKNRENIPTANCKNPLSLSSSDLSLPNILVKPSSALMTPNSTNLKIALPTLIKTRKKSTAILAFFSLDSHFSAPYRSSVLKNLPSDAKNPPPSSGVMSVDPSPARAAAALASRPLSLAPSLARDAAILASLAACLCAFASLIFLLRSSVARPLIESLTSLAFLIDPLVDLSILVLILCRILVCSFN